MTSLRMTTTLKSKPLSERLQMSSKIIANNPDRVPVIVSKLSFLNPKSDLTKTKFICPRSLTIGQMIFIIRRFLVNLKSSAALFLTVSETKVIPTTGDKIGDVYDKHKEKDGFLYFVIYTENVFG